MSVLSNVWNYSDITRSACAKRLLPRPAVPAGRYVTRVQPRGLSIVTQRRGECVIVTENPKTIGDSTVARYGRTGTLVDPTLFFFLSLQIARITFKLWICFPNEQETLRKETRRFPFEDREVYAVGPYPFLNTSKILDFIQMYDEGRGAKVVRGNKIRKDRGVSRESRERYEGFVGWGMNNSHNFCVSAIFFSAGYILCSLCPIFVSGGLSFPSK